MAREAKTKTDVAVTRTSRVNAVEDAPKKVRVSKKTAEPTAVFNPYASIDKELEIIERDCALVSAGVDVLEDRISTGLLQVDLLLCGGVVGGGWYTNFGPEQSTKTTGAIAVLATALLQGVPIIYYFDYENSFQPDYFEKVVATLFRSVGKTPLTTDEIFGVRDSKGVWVKPPRIRIYQDSIAEKFFNSVSRLLKSLPQKRKIGESWYYVYDDTKENRAKVGSFYDKQYYQKTKTFRVPAQDSKPQALVLVDSYPAMLPELIDEKDEGGNAGGLAVQARMFSDNIKRVKGRMRSRRVTVLGINQLRTNPGARFSNPEYEPGGDALKFYSDVRLRYYSRALSGVPYVKATSGQIEEESSVEGKGNDTYRYVHVRAHKNKLSTPGLEGWVRVWISDRKGKARGYCPVWDTFIYLENTGQIKSSAKSERKNLSLNLRRLNAEGKVVPIKYTGECFDWLTFKRWVLGTKEEIAEICERFGFKKPFRLRKFCFDQMSSAYRLPDGTLLGTHLYFSKMYDDGTEIEPGEEDGDPHHEADDE